MATHVADPAKILFYDATTSAKNAVNMEKSNQLQAAIQYYNEAALKAQTAIDTGLSSDLVSTAQNLVTRASNRSAELSTFFQTSNFRANSEPHPKQKFRANARVTSTFIGQPQPLVHMPIPTNRNFGPQNSVGPGAGQTGMDMSSAIVHERPNIKFADVAGLDAAKSALNEAVIMPIQLPKMFSGPTQPWKGILLYGPPGTGKSFLAKALAGECGDATFLTVSTADLTSKWVGESEKLIKGLFETARATRPAVVFIDEIDSLCSARGEQDTETDRRIKTEFLIQMDGFQANNSGVVVVAATNLPWALDPAMRRRFEKRIYIPLPDAKARATLLKLHLKGAVHELSEADISHIARSTEGFSGADLAILTRDALMQPLRELQTATSWVQGRGIDGDGKERDKLWLVSNNNSGILSLFHPFGRSEKQCKWDELPKEDIARPPLEMRHMQASLKKVRPSVASSDLQRYQDWTREYGEDGT